MWRMTATYEDYAWFDERFPKLAEAYCLTLARGLTPAELLERMGARDEGVRVTGAEQLVEPGSQCWREHNGDALFIGATAVGQWALAVEPNGYLGSLIRDPDSGAPLSAGTTVVSHYYQNGNGHSDFSWAEDGDLRLNFEPLFPNERDGSTPDALVEQMRQAGFEFGEEFDEDDDANIEFCGDAAFALAEHITGVRLTPELLEGATFICGVAPVPRR